MINGINKKSLSPVIASVLMILLVLFLASMIFSWSRGFMEKQIDSSERPISELCSYVDFSAIIYKDEGILEVTNRGNINISSFEIKEYYKGNSEITMVNMSVPAGKSISGAVILDIAPDCDKVEIFPVLKRVDNGRLVVCDGDPAPLTVLNS